MGIWYHFLSFVPVSPFYILWRKALSAAPRRDAEKFTDIQLEDLNNFLGVIEFCNKHLRAAKRLKVGSKPTQRGGARARHILGETDGLL